MQKPMNNQVNQKRRKKKTPKDMVRTATLRNASHK
jgi:hypothetical protein